MIANSGANTGQIECGPHFPCLRWGDAVEKTKEMRRTLQFSKCRSRQLALVSPVEAIFVSLLALAGRGHHGLPRCPTYRGRHPQCHRSIERHRLDLWRALVESVESSSPIWRTRALYRASLKPSSCCSTSRGSRHLLATARRSQESDLDRVTPEKSDANHPPCASGRCDRSFLQLNRPYRHSRTTQFVRLTARLKTRRFLAPNLYRRS